jgi:FkbM family methyltransferase
VNISAISDHSYFGKALRLPLRLIPEAAVVPVLQGPLRGKRWRVGSSNHGCWLGSYEYEKQRVLQRSIKPGDVVYDIGANVGFYTLLASTLVAEHGRVYAFEPLPSNLEDLRNHLKLNRIRNSTVIEAAVSSRDGEAYFDPSMNRSQGRLSSTGTIVVRTVMLDSWLRQNSFRPPSLMKIDIEGAEAECLRGAEHTIRTSRPIILLATHNHDLHAACIEMLSDWKYDLRPLDAPIITNASEIVAEPY